MNKNCMSVFDCISHITKCDHLKKRIHTLISEKEKLEYSVNLAFI